MIGSLAVDVAGPLPAKACRADAPAQRALAEGDALLVEVRREQRRSPCVGVVAAGARVAREQLLEPSVGELRPAARPTRSSGVTQLLGLALGPVALDPAVHRAALDPQPPCDRCNRVAVGDFNQGLQSPVEPDVVDAVQRSQQSPSVGVVKNSMCAHARTVGPSLGMLQDLWLPT